MSKHGQMKAAAVAGAVAGTGTTAAVRRGGRPAPERAGGRTGARAEVDAAAPAAGAAPGPAMNGGGRVSSGAVAALAEINSYVPPPPPTPEQEAEFAAKRAELMARLKALDAASPESMAGELKIIAKMFGEIKPYALARGGVRRTPEQEAAYEAFRAEINAEFKASGEGPALTDDELDEIIRQCRREGRPVPWYKLNTSSLQYLRMTRGAHPTEDRDLTPEEEDEFEEWEYRAADS